MQQTPLTPIQKLDVVLKSLATLPDEKSALSFDEIFNEIMRRHPSFDKTAFKIELSRILRKLVGDEYVIKHDVTYKGVSGRNSVFFVSFDGHLFITEKGGYEQKFIDDERENSRLTKLELSRDAQGKALNRLTGWVAGGTIALAFLEFLNLAYEHHWFGLK